MFVLGIDPGLSRCGYACVEAGVRGARGGAGGGARARAIGVIRTDPADPLPARLAELHAELCALLAEVRPAVVAVEQVFFQVNVRSAMAVGQASGLAMAAAHAAGAEVVQYTPTQVKQAVAGDGRADKEQVGRMVQALLGLARVPEPADAADAAALALCHLAHSPLRRAAVAARR
ncbi:MAG TPA: crossover junction endodeoxyribonuclease RuvC [Iamia sp.]|nr:crossover junction endodeoxyribonuclease RuvC [Iamia sp.]